MALKIGLDNVVKIMRPVEKKFNLQELNNCVDGFIEPLKIGPIWVMYDEAAKKRGEPVNDIASFFFQIAMYGTVLVVPPQQLPSDWGVLEDEDEQYTADEIDTGFLISLQNALMYNRVFGNGKDPEEFLSKFIPKEEWTYKPLVDGELDENTIDFYMQVYDYICRNPESFKENILLSESDVVVRLENDKDRELIINQMLEYFIKEEEYEKCVTLRQVMK